MVSQKLTFKDITILQEGRTREITLEQAVQFAKQHCRQYFSVPEHRKYAHVFRGNYKFSGIGVIYPQKGEPRVSANTSNHYTLIMDNSPNWKQYPQRSRSIVCSTSPTTANVYGDVLAVFPSDNAVFGVCPASDLWDSFHYIEHTAIKSKFPGDGAVIFNSAMAAFEKYGTGATGYRRQEYERLLENFMMVEKKFKEDVKNHGLETTFLNIYQNLNIRSIHDQTDTPVGNIIRYFIHHMLQGKTILSIAQDLLDPRKNGFQLVSNTELYKLYSEGAGLEVWTSHPCLLVPEEWSSDINTTTFFAALNA